MNRPDRAERRRRGKSDPLDTQNAARVVLIVRVRARIKAGDGPVRRGRMYKLAQSSAAKARTQAVNPLKVVLVTAAPNLLEELAGMNDAEPFRTCARLADDSKSPVQDPPGET